MKNIKSVKIWFGSVTGFILSTLLITVGFWKTIFIVAVTIFAGWIGALLEEYKVDFSRVTDLFTRRNQ